MANLILNTANINKIEEAYLKAAIATMNSIQLDVDQSQTVPFLSGQLDGSKFVDTSDPYRKGIQLQYSAPYVNYQYFTPGLNHYTGQHANATDHWLDPYLSGGSKENFAQEQFEKHFKREMRR